MRAALYVRVSTDEQARDGYSLAAQEERARAYCTAKGWEVTAVYVDAGRSGKSIDGREALTQLLQDAAGHAFDQVIFWRLDRLGRNLRDLLEISERLDAAGAGVVSIDEGFDTTTTAGRLMRNVLGSLAVFERETTVDRIKVGMQEAARQGNIVGPLSLGYRRDETGIVLMANIPEIIHEMFERYAAGHHSLSQLAAWANSQGLRSSRGNVIDKLSVRKLLTNVHYVGDVAYHRRQGGGVVAADAIPAIVSRDLFDRVQRQLASRRRMPPEWSWGRQPYPLTGVAFCGACGAGLLGSMSTVSEKKTRYLRCSTAARRGRLACSQPMVQAELVEAQVGAYLDGFTLPADAVEQVMDELRQLFDQGENVDQDIRRIEGVMARQRRLFVIGDIDELSYRRETAPLRKRLDSLQQSGQVLDVERALYHMRNISSLWRQSERQEQREFVNEVFDRIVLDGAQVTELTPKPAYAPLFMLDREARFGGLVSWLPGQDLSSPNYKPVSNPRTIEPFYVPALALAG